MSKMTITEALQEIKTIGSRLEKKRASVGPYVARDSRIRDPLEKDGGSEAFISSTRQAMSDLEERVIKIRTAIQRSNLDSSISVGDKTRTVAEWLTWRREISNGHKAFLQQISGALANLRQQIQVQGGRFVAGALAVNEGTGPKDPPQMVVNIDERKLLADLESLEQILGTLDGKLSLFNATTTIEV